MRREVPSPPQGLRPVDPREWVRVWNRVLHSAPVKATGYALAARADYKTGADIHPGNELLTLMTGLSDKAVRDALKEIRRMEFAWRYLEGSKAPFINTRNGRKRPSDEYQLTWPDDLSAIRMLSPDDDMPDLTVLAALWITLRTPVPPTGVRPSGRRRTPVPPTGVRVRTPVPGTGHP